MYIVIYIHIVMYNVMIDDMRLTHIVAALVCTVYVAMYSTVYCMCVLCMWLCTAQCVLIHVLYVCTVCMCVFVLVCPHYAICFIHCAYNICTAHTTS